MRLKFNKLRKFSNSNSKYQPTMRCRFRNKKLKQIYKINKSNQNHKITQNLRKIMSLKKVQLIN